MTYTDDCTLPAEMLEQISSQGFDALPERARQVEHQCQVNELYSEIGRLTTQLNWLKKIWLRRVEASCWYIQQ